MPLESELVQGRAFITKHSPPGRILLCGVTGSHYYGFPAPDSDLDLKGIHVAPLRDILSLEPPKAAVNIEGLEGGLLCDYTSNEVEQAMRLLLKGNGNMLERIFSPIQVFETDELFQLRTLSAAYLSRRVFHHYKGFFFTVCDLHLKDGLRRIKPLLYSYRTALTGIHLLNTGKVVGDVTILAPQYGFNEALGLVSRYRSSSEKTTVSPDEDTRHQSHWPNLLKELEQAFEQSHLPEEPMGLRACSEWLVNLRCSERP